jgi:hypothetical protein
MGSTGGSQSSNRSSQTVWGGQQKYLKDLYKRAQSEVANQPMEYYQGQTVAGRDPASLAYEQDALQYAGAGNAGLNQAGAYNSDVLSGQYLDPASNPHLRGTFDAASRAVTDNYRDAVLPQLQSRFALAGQGASGNFAGAYGRANQALGTSLSELGSSIYGGNYQAERGRMEAARNFSPTFAADQMDRLDIQRGVGAQREGYQQELINDLIARFDFAQNEPGLRLSRYAGLLGSPTVLGDSSSHSTQADLSILKFFGK